jgi:hypothetical protein
MACSISSRRTRPSSTAARTSSAEPTNEGVLRPTAGQQEARPQRSELAGARLGHAGSARERLEQPVGVRHAVTLDAGQHDRCRGTRHEPRVQRAGNQLADHRRRRVGVAFRARKIAPAQRDQCATDRRRGLGRPRLRRPGGLFQRPFDQSHLVGDERGRARREARQRSRAFVVHLRVARQRPLTEDPRRVRRRVTAHRAQAGAGREDRALRRRRALQLLAAVQHRCHVGRRSLVEQRQLDDRPSQAQSEVRIDVARELPGAAVKQIDRLRASVGPRGRLGIGDGTRDEVLRSLGTSHALVEVRHGVLVPTGL